MRGILKPLVYIVSSLQPGLDMSSQTHWVNLVFISLLVFLFHDGVYIHHLSDQVSLHRYVDILLHILGAAQGGPVFTNFLFVVPRCYPGFFRIALVLRRRCEKCQFSFRQIIIVKYKFFIFRIIVFFLILCDQIYSLTLLQKRNVLLPQDIIVCGNAGGYGGFAHFLYILYVFSPFLSKMFYFRFALWR